MLCVILFGRGLFLLWDIMWCHMIESNHTSLYAPFCLPLLFSITLSLFLCLLVCGGALGEWAQRGEGGSEEAQRRAAWGGASQTAQETWEDHQVQQQKHTLSCCHPKAKLGIAQSCELFKRLSCQQYRSDSCDSLTLSNLWKIRKKTRMQFVFTLLQKCEDSLCHLTLQMFCFLLQTNTN